MANFEYQEAINPVDAHGAISSLNDYAMIRQNALAQNDKQLNDSLVGNGTLPQLDLADGEDKAAEYRNPVKPKDITSKEMKESGITANQEVDGDTKTTNGKYPRGIDVSTSNGKTIKTDDGREIHITNSSLVTVKPPLHESKPGSGVFVDEKGRAVAKVNDDGTVTVDTGKGFYTQGPDGIKRVSALRSRDGKDFEVLDTDSPLGGLRPSDPTNHSKKR